MRSAADITIRPMSPQGMSESAEGTPPGSASSCLLASCLTLPASACAPASGTDLIRQLLTVDPQKRLTARAALEHRWFQACERQLSQRSLAEARKKMMEDTKNKQQHHLKTVVDMVGA